MFRKLLITILRFYQTFISPLKAPSCRFYPSCSSYAIQCLENYGFLKGLFKIFIRLIKCHPFHPGGYDPA